MAKQFSKPTLALIDTHKIVGIRAGGGSHRFTGIWAVVVGGRAFVRSWNGRTGGWYEELLAARHGVLQVGTRTIRVRAHPIRSERLRDAVDAALAAKYNTPGSRKWVRGFARPTRRERTIELTPD